MLPESVVAKVSRMSGGMGGHAAAGGDLVLGVEVVEEGPPADVRFLTDFVDGDLVEPALEDELGGAVLEPEIGFASLAFAQSALAGVRHRVVLGFVPCLSHRTVLHRVKTCTQCKISLTPIRGWC